jgi:hypothetical protein
MAAGQRKDESVEKTLTPSFDFNGQGPPSYAMVVDGTLLEMVADGALVMANHIGSPIEKFPPLLSN